MKHRLILLACTFCLLALANQCWPQSPFQAKPESSLHSVQEEPGLIGEALMHINLWQRRINQQMGELGREVQQDLSLQPFFLLLGLSLLYGLVHAAGPGHGKVVILSYAVTRGRLSASLLVGNLTAIFHGLGGIILVLMVKFVLDASIRGALAQTTQATGVISYGLMAMLGALLLGRALWSCHAKKKEPDAPKRDVPPWLMALAAGLIPCPGVALVMLFFLSQNMVWLGVLMALAMSMGMAITITAVAIAAYAGKGLSLMAASRNPAASKWVGCLMETGAALALLVLGLLFLAASLYGNGLPSTL
jgi:nickel/cobalt exporter